MSSDAELDEPISCDDDYDDAPQVSAGGSDVFASIFNYSKIVLFFTVTYVGILMQLVG